MRRRGESGQATTEVAIAALAIIFVTAGMLVVGGIGISSIKSLIAARTRAEVRAASAREGDGGVGSDLADWSHTRVVYRGDDAIEVPFLAEDRARATTAVIGSGVLTEARFSQAERESGYLFLSLNETPGLHLPAELFASRSSELAQLVSGHGALAPESEGEDIYLLKDLRDRRSFRQSLMPWLNLRNVDIADWPSSTVRFPAFGGK